MLETSVQCYSLTLWLLNNSSSNSQNKMQHLVFLRLDAAGSRLGVFDVAKEMLPAYPRPGHPGPQSGQHPPNTMEDNNNNNNVLNDQNNNNTLEEVSTTPGQDTAPPQAPCPCPSSYFSHHPQPPPEYQELAPVNLQLHPPPLPR